MDVPIHNFGGVPGVSLVDARAVLFPIPYDATVCYGRGAARGPAALLDASEQLELFDEEMMWEPYLAGLHTLPMLEPDMSGPEAMLQTIEQAVRPLLVPGRPLIGLGGEHSITAGLLAAHRQVFGENFTVLQLDAHADLRNIYQGTPWSHACVMRRVIDLGLPLVQVGIRSLSVEEWSFVQDTKLEKHIHWAKRIVCATATEREAWLESLVSSLGKQVYITLDLDVLDPAVMPAVGTPEPGGLDYYTTLEILRRVTSRCEVIGADIVELAPIPGQPASDFTAARILYKLLGYLLHNWK